MPSDLQLIDGFEQLREQWAAEHEDSPSLDPPPPRERPAATSPEAWVIEAWIQAQDGRDAATGPQRRRVRNLARALIERHEHPHREPDRERAALLTGEEALVRRARALLPRLEAARRAQLDPLAAHPPERSISQELAAWRLALPALAGLRGWRFMERLGRPVVVPESPLRRFLWRLGLVDRPPAGAGSDALAHAELERIARLTGLTSAHLAALLSWHAGATGACGARPRCEACPFRPGCGWAKYNAHPASPGAAIDAGKLTPRRALEPLHRQIVAGKLDQLQEVELLAALVQGGTAQSGPLETAEALLRRFGGLPGLDRASVPELAQVPGISRARAIQLKSALELGRRLAGRSLQAGQLVRSSEDVWQAFRTRFRNLPQEHFVVLLMDAKNRVIHDHIVSKGTLTGSLAHPREVFKEALRHAAAGIILMHNHPSGDPHPSPEDRAVTTRLREAGEILGIRVLDHIILGDGDYFSFKDSDLL